MHTAKSGRPVSIWQVDEYHCQKWFQFLSPMFLSVVLKEAVSPVSWVIFKTLKKFESRKKVYTFGILWLEI